MTSRYQIIAFGALLCAGTTTASAALVSPEMFEFAADPGATWGAPIASLDVNTETGYTWASGFQAAFGPGITELTSRVYSVTSPMVLNQGLDSLTLNVGDQVYAYTITLVEDSATTVDTLAEFQVGLLDFGGGPIMDGSLVKGRGFVSDGTNGPAGANAGDFEDFGGFGSSLDWVWPSLEADQLQNDQTITVLMFTEVSIPIVGIGNLRAPTGQISGGGNVTNLAPVLVPTTIPSPGAATIGLLAGMLCTRRPRRGG